jgi:hypothetical protein
MKYCPRFLRAQDKYFPLRKASFAHCCLHRVSCKPEQGGCRVRSWTRIGKPGELT